jgi:NAD(P)-dependent dehydrogenase (short-subunit alcohol dehydrogenase family)
MLGTTASAPITPATAYTASKHGVMGLTKTDAIYYAPQHIRINAMCPGYIGTPLLKTHALGSAMESELARVPMQRFGEMEEIADSIAFLASPMSSFMCGQGLVVDG